MVSTIQVYGKLNIHIWESYIKAISTKILMITNVNNNLEKTLKLKNSVRNSSIRTSYALQKSSSFQKVSWFSSPIDIPIKPEPYNNMSEYSNWNCDNNQSLKYLKIQNQYVKTSLYLFIKLTVCKRITGGNK